VTLGGLAGTGSLGVGSAIALTVGGNNSDTSYSGNIGSGTSLTKVGMGTLTLSGATRPYTGGTFLNAGTVSVSDDRNLGATSGGLTFGGGTLQITASYSSTRAVTINSGGGTISVDSGMTLTASGALGGTGGLTKAGAGTLTLTGGSNNFTGGTTISAGTLAVAASGTLPTAGGVNVGSGATLDVTALPTFAVGSGTLGGTGIVLGRVTVSGGGTIRPGGATTVGTLTVSNGTVTLQDGAIFDVAAGNTAASSLAVSGNILNLSGAETLRVFNDGSLVFGQPYTYTIANASTVLHNQTFSVVAGNFSGFAGTPSVTSNGQNLVLSFTPVPEPAAALGVCALAAAAWVGFWRRRWAETANAL
jgi:autotransporter-associated beta strand protein